MPTEPKQLKDSYVVVDPKGQAETWKSEDFWKMAFDPEHPKNKPDLGYLVSQYDFDSDWNNWENHPNGDEIVFCISGKLTFILEQTHGNQVTELSPGDYVVVPKNTWHTARVSEPSKVLFITWGFGTQHREK